MLNIITKKLKKCGIYVLKSPSGKYYVGQCWDFDDRMKKYKSLNVKKQRALYNALKHYGFAAFEVVFTPYPKEMLDWAEVTLIAAYGSFTGGYNCTKGGDGTKGMKHSDESKKKMSEANLGRKHSDETKKKMSLSKMNNKHSLGYKPTTEHKEKIRKAMLGQKRIFTEEWKRNISKSKMNNKNALGYKHTDEAKEKMRNAKLGKYGKKHSAETKEKMRAARLRYINLHK